MRARRALAGAATLTLLLTPPAIAQRVVVGTSAGGRAIVAHHVGAGTGPVVLVVGCIHGNECAGNAVLRRLVERPPAGVDLWLVPQLNPDGAVARTRQNGRGVDLNRNWAVGWRPNGPRWGTFHPGPRPFSEPETRAGRDLAVRLRPAAAIWYHQHLDLIWAWGRGVRGGRAYAERAGMRLLLRRSLPGSASRWMNETLGSGSSFTVELPAGALPPSAVARHAAAVAAVADAVR